VQDQPEAIDMHEHWEKRAITYKTQLNKRKLRKHHAWQAKFLRECFDPLFHEYIIEIGCGTGRILKIIREELPDSEIIGIDFSQEMLNQVEVKNVLLEIGNALKLPFEDKMFDLALSFEVLLHLTFDEAVTALKEMKRIAKELIVCTYTGKKADAPYCYAHDYDKMFGKVGLKIVSREDLEGQSCFVLGAI